MATPAGESKEFGMAGIEAISPGADLPARELGKAAQARSTSVALFVVTAVDETTTKKLETIPPESSQVVDRWLSALCAKTVLWNAGAFTDEYRRSKNR